jgi:hypothetical protein
VQDGRIFIELLNGAFLFEHRGTPAEYGAGLKLAIDRGWLWKHESGTYVRMTQAGAPEPRCKQFIQRAGRATECQKITKPASLLVLCRDIRGTSEDRFCGPVRLAV